MAKKFPQVIMDINIGSQPAGRITFELFTDITPRTAENFRALCTGEFGNTTVDGKPQKLHYKGSKFHRVIDQFVVQGGDIVKGDGTGNTSIYNGPFADENFTRRHACAGLLSMANAGRNSNGCQFFITLKECPHLDGKHVVFGQVVDGMQVVRKMAKVPVDINDKPKIPVEVVACDQIGDQRQHIRNDPFSKENQILVKKSELERENQLTQEQEILNKNLDALKKIDEQLKQLDEQKAQEKAELTTFKSVEKKLSTKAKDRLLDIQLKINAAKRNNTRAVLEEEKKSTDPNYEKNKKSQKYNEKKAQKIELLEARGYEKNQTYMNQTAAQAEHLKGKKSNNNYGFGWNVFNTDSLYKAYDKRCSGLQLNEEHYEKQKQNPDVGGMEEGLNRLSEDLQKQVEKRAKFQNRKKDDPEQVVNYINDRNKVYNDKLKRHFDPYVQDIKVNLEQRGATK